MTLESMSPLEVWNKSRELAAVTHTIADKHSDVDLETARRETDMYPFVTIEEVTAIVNGVPGETRADRIDAIQRIINEHLKESHRVKQNHQKKSREVLDVWNTAQSAASAVLTWNTEPIDTRDPYDVIHSEYSTVLPESKGVLTKILSTVPDTVRKEQHEYLTRQLYEYTTDSTSNNDGSESTRERDTTVDSGICEDPVEDIADSLLVVFVDHDNPKYSDIADRYPDIEFPPRNVSLMEVLNSGGETREERKENVSAWVETWYDDPDRVAELRENSPRPMGVKSS